jgi:hypothetical protein
MEIKPLNVRKLKAEQNARLFEKVKDKNLAKDLIIAYDWKNSMLDVVRRTDNYDDFRTEMLKHFQKREEYFQKIPSIINS